MNIELSSPVVELAGLFMTIFAAVWSLAWWLSGKFSQINRLIFEQIDKLEQHFTTKLEYHEKHDDQRFNSISNDLWELKIRNAAMRGYIDENPKPKKLKETT